MEIYGTHYFKRNICEKEHKFVKCEVMVLDEEEKLPPTDRREILLYCPSCGDSFNEISDQSAFDINDAYPETELIDQYEDFDDR